MPKHLKLVMSKVLASKRPVGLALAIVLLMGVGNASAEFQPETISGTQEAAAEVSPSPSPDASEEDGITPPGGGGGNINNKVVVTNTVDGRSAHRAGVGVARVTDLEARNQNAAAATSSCSDCRTVAVAAQAVIVQRTNASTIAPQNYAIALNQNCVRCETFAAAYQYVFTTDGLVRFTEGAQQKLAGFEQQIKAVAAEEDLSFSAMEAKIDALVEEMWALVKTELEAVGVKGAGRAVKDTDETTEDAGNPSPSPTPSPSESPSVLPTASTTPSGTGGDDDEPSPTPSVSPSESTSPSPSPSSG